MADIDGDILYSIISSFADDSRISKIIRSTSDGEQLQEDLRTVYKWAEVNNMEFNSEKFEKISYNPTNEPFSYHADNDAEIQSNSVIKDL